ncbi:MAG: LytR/AlgR family response regulator transcription factor [Bacteroidia bacterium]
MSKQVYRIMVVEDEELMADKIEMQIEKLGYEPFAIVDNSEDALKAIETKQPDLILMDVNIEGEYDGIELTDLIHQQHQIPIIFISSNQDDHTFRRLSRTNPLGFILKPFSEIQLQRSIELAFQQIAHAQPFTYEMDEAPVESEKREFVFIKSQKKLHKIKIEEIFYLEADGRYSQVHTVDKKFLIRLSLKEMFEKVDNGNFIQTHRSFIVNMDKIKSVDLEDSVVILENMHIPISRREKDNILEKLDWV